MPSTAPTRVDEDLFASAKHASEFTGRSAAQQLTHWARVGREVEASQAMSVRDVESRLADAQSYDELGPEEQAQVRAEWAEGIERRRRKLDLAAIFRRLGVPWVESDAEGNVVRHDPRGFDPAAVTDEIRAELGIREAASADILAALAKAEARLAAAPTVTADPVAEEEPVPKAPRRNSKKLTEAGAIRVQKGTRGAQAIPPKKNQALANAKAAGKAGVAGRR